MLRKVGVRALLVAISVLFTLGLGELAMRTPVAVSRTGGNSPGVRLFESTRYDHVADGTPGNIRSLHVVKAKEAGVFRIVTLGDSYTWGSKIPNTADIWPYQVESLVAGAMKPTRVEVVNLGRPGFTTVNEAEMLRRVGWLFHPDLVLIDFTINDSLPSGPNFAFEGEEWYFHLAPLSPIGHDWLDRHSYLYSYFNAAWQGYQMQRDYPQGYTPLFDDNFQGWRDCQAAMGEMGQAAREHHAGILLAVFPAFRSDLGDGSYQFLEVHQKVLKAAEEAGIHALDLRPIYAQVDPKGRDWWALPCDAHPNREGHRVAAEAIVSELKRLHLVHP